MSWITAGRVAAAAAVVLARRLTAHQTCQFSETATCRRVRRQSSEKVISFVSAVLSPAARHRKAMAAATPPVRQHHRGG